MKFRPPPEDATGKDGLDSLHFLHFSRQSKFRNEHLLQTHYPPEELLGFFLSWDLERYLGLSRSWDLYLLECYFFL